MIKKMLVYLYVLSFSTGCLSAPASSPTSLASPTPFPEKLMENIAVGKYTLSLFCEGKGEPTILLENGLDVASWTAADLSRFKKLGRTCRYMRAGWSGEALAGTRTTQDQVNELHSLLELAGVPGPYVLVGHSIAGLNLLLYTHDYPEQVVGLVCVDCHSPSLQPLVLEKLGSEQPDEPDDVKALRLEFTQGWEETSKGRERLDLLASDEQARQVTSLGDLPFVWLVAEVVLPEPPTQILTWAKDTIYSDAQAISQLSSKGRMEIVPSVDHWSILQSKAVDAAVQEVYQAAASKSGLIIHEDHRVLSSDPAFR
jgi:pimeloyl-ACP methyl ester carboxylesterase